MPMTEFDLLLKQADDLSAKMERTLLTNHEVSPSQEKVSRIRRAIDNILSEADEEVTARAGSAG